MYIRTQEKGAVTPQETEPDLPVSVQESPVKAFIDGGPLQGQRTLRAALHARGLLKEVTIVFITSTIVWPQIKQQGGNTAPAINIKLD